MLFSRVPHLRYLGYTYDVEIDEEPGEVRKIMWHQATRYGRVVFETNGPVYNFMTAGQFETFVKQSEETLK